MNFKLKINYSKKEKIYSTNIFWGKIFLGNLKYGGSK
jgi:hypothetical protein